MVGMEVKGARLKKGRAIKLAMSQTELLFSISAVAQSASSATTPQSLRLPPDLTIPSPYPLSCLSIKVLRKKPQSCFSYLLPCT